MVILSLTNCPPSLRGDLSKWLNEINTGLYIGKLSARVRDELWDRICDNIRDGQATMIYSASNAQGYEILVHNSSWTPVDYEGITLMKRPLKQVQGKEEKLKPGFSKAARYEMARKPMSSGVKQFVVLDLETTGLDAEKDQIVEIGALRIDEDKITNVYHCFIRQAKNLPENIKKLTGISDEIIRKEGIDEEEAINELLEFVGSYRVIGYNIKFDLRFIRKACERYKVEDSIKRTIDVLDIARRKLENIDNYKLESVSKALNIGVEVSHRAVEDCRLIFETYMKLNML